MSHLGLSQHSNECTIEPSIHLIIIIDIIPKITYNLFILLFLYNHINININIINYLIKRIYKIKIKVMIDNQLSAWLSF